MLAKALFAEAERPTDSVNLSLGCLPAFGVLQMQLLPGGMHWLIQILHLLVGFAAVGVGQVLARRIVKSKAQPA